MQVKSKNGVKLDLHPTNPWNPLDWIAVFHAARQIKAMPVYMNTKDWKITYCSTSEDQPSSERK